MSIPTERLTVVTTVRANRLEHIIKEVQPLNSEYPDPHLMPYRIECIKTYPHRTFLDWLLGRGYLWTITYHYASRENDSDCEA